LLNIVSRWERWRSSIAVCCVRLYRVSDNYQLG